MSLEEVPLVTVPADSLIATEAAALDLEGGAPVVPVVSTGLSSETKGHLVSGTAALATGVMLERGAGFLANILAARLGGAPVFGAYSLAISTANNISTYAAGGIGATATRFSGKYPYGSGSYAVLARVLAVVSLASALMAGAALWFGAGPIAHLLGKDSLTSLLRWASISAVGIIVLECARGFFVGQRRIAALLLLSVFVGGGMLLFLPWAAAAHNPSRMILAQGCVTGGAVLLCLLFASKLRLKDREVQRYRFAPMLREVWGFGFVQLAGLVGSNLAGWWLTTLIARSDTTLVQMSFFAIASQLRNLAGIAPGLMTEGSYAVMASPDDADARTPHRVMALCSFASLSVALVLGCAGMAIAPWLLQLLYGATYRAAGLTAAMALAVAVVHMGNAPAAARLTIVSVRTTGAINTGWAIFVAVAGTLLLLHGGAAWQGMAILLAAHLLSSTLVLSALHRRDQLPEGMALVYGVGALASVVLASLALLRASHPGKEGLLTLAMLLVAAGTSAALFLLGRRYRWLPSKQSLQALVAKLRSRASGLGKGSVVGGSHV
ncbi:lipopolysaccharide biosynthesis protein [Terriglobus sp.]|uniref:lipopolysaccharide biosynthesis protein n=1 Tax=Terriglobus sp. TaxID=1889013 RepID=UPI003B005667